MAAPISSISASFRDYNNEASHIRLWINNLTAGNIVAQTTAVNTFLTDLEAVTLGLMVAQTITLSTIQTGGGMPASVNAQRETKWLFRYHDTVTQEKFVAECPCADLSLLGFHIDFADMSTAPFVALAASWAQLIRGPNDNNPTVLDSAQHVGRNL